MDVDICMDDRNDVSDTDCRHSASHQLPCQVTPNERVELRVNTLKGVLPRLNLTTDYILFNRQVPR